MQTTNNLLQHSVLRLGFHEPVGPQDQRVRGTLKSVGLRHEAAPPGDGLAIERFRDADAVDAATVAQQFDWHRVVVPDGEWCDHGECFGGAHSWTLQSGVPAFSDPD
jgi:hypothetical protein